MYRLVVVTVIWCLENPTPTTATNPDLLNEQAILCELYIDSDDSDVSCIYDIVFVPTVGIQPKKERTLKVVCSAVISVRGKIKTIIYCLCKEVRHCRRLNSPPQGTVYITSIYL